MGVFINNNSQIFMNKQELKQALETIFFVATRPLNTKQLTKIIGDCETKIIGELVSELNESYKKKIDATVTNIGPPKVKETTSANGNSLKP